MTSISVHASKDYNVIVGQGLLKALGDYAASVKHPCKAIIVSDSNVFPLYGSTALQSLSNSGFQARSFVFEAGEASKNSETYLKLLNFLAENQISRSDCLIALGGGVVGDLTGFAAATYLRGIDYIQVPTTLLAAVDSSVGGKTAIDLPAGKNLVGAFYQPRLVLCDTDTLDSLPASVFLDGCAEVIKYAVLFDPGLFDQLKAEGVAFQREAVIARCVQWKRDVVAEDEFDHGKRQLLNLGHTIGHGVETHSQFSVSHGNAVAMGMAIIARSAEKMGLCSNDTCHNIISLLKDFGLPVSTGYSADALFECALSDKKRSGSKVNLIIPTKIGECRIYPTLIEELKSFIQAGL